MNRHSFRASNSFMTVFACLVVLFAFSCSSLLAEAGQSIEIDSAKGAEANFKIKSTVKELLNSERTAASIDRIVSKITSASGCDTRVQVISSSDIFSRVFPQTGEIQISKALLNSVYKSSGAKGVAFLLGHEIGHMKVDPSFRGAVTEFEADRIGFDIARKVYPDLKGSTVKDVFSTFDKAGSKNPASNMLNKMRGSIDPSHPTDIARLDYLARSNKYSAKLGFDNVSGRGGFLASPENTLKSSGTSVSGKGALAKGAASVKSDFLKGGLLVDVAVSAGSSIYSSMSSGGSFGEGMKNAGKYLGSSTFIVGDLMGGAVGAALGSMIPLPASFIATGLLGQSIATFPAIAGAMLGAQLGITAIELIKDGNFSFKTLFSSIEVFNTGFRAVGASIGMAVGSLIPIPYVGTIVGGLCGTILADKIISLFKGPSITAVDERASSENSSALASDSAIVSSESDNLAQASENGSSSGTEDLKIEMEKHYADFVQYNKAEKLDLAVESLLRYRESKTAYENHVSLQTKSLAQ